MGWIKGHLPLVLVLIVGIAAIGGVKYYSANQTASTPITVSYSPKPSATPAVSAAPTLAVTPSPESTLTSVDATYNLYTNTKLGFSIKVPKADNISGYSCKYTTENGDHSYRPVSGMVPITMLNDGNTVHMANTYFYQLSGETKSGDISYFSKCNKVTVTSEMINNAIKNPVKYSDYGIVHWDLVEKSINSDAELAKFMRAQYGAQCEIADKKASTQDGVFDVTVVKSYTPGYGETGNESNEPKCVFYNKTSVMKYDPAKKGAVTWAPSPQDKTFGDTTGKTYDDEINKSFKFIQ